MKIDNISFKSFAVWIIILCFVIIYGILFAVSSSISGSIDSQNAVERWVNPESEIRYAQISVFISEDAEFGYSNIMSFRNTLDTSLKDASSKGANRNIIPYIDAYSAELQLNVYTDKANAAVNALAVSGEFFVFHPLKLKSGSYLNSGSIMKDSVVIDEVLAWQLYGSVEVAGLTMYIGTKPYIISGVVERGYDKLTELAYGDKPRMYMMYEALDSEMPVTCYELLMTNPVSDYAYNIVKDEIGLSNDNSVIIENTTRFDAFKLYGTVSELGKRAMRFNRVVYPYWENIAVVIEGRCAVLLLFETISLASAGLIFIVYVFIMWHKYSYILKKFIKDTVSKIENIRIPDKSEIRKGKNENAVTKNKID